MVCIEKEVNDIIIVTLKGKLILPADTDQLHDHIKSVLDRNIKKIILNLKNITRISSLGIGAILRALSIVREANGDLRLTGLDTNIKNIFEITKIIGVIQIYDNIDQAMTSFT